MPLIYIFHIIYFTYHSNIKSRTILVIYSRRICFERKVILKLSHEFKHIWIMPGSHFSCYAFLDLLFSKCVSTVHKICIYFEFIKKENVHLQLPVEFLVFMQIECSCFLSTHDTPSALGKLHFLIQKYRFYSAVYISYLMQESSSIRIQLK